jgi:hypothetical protein
MHGEKYDALASRHSAHLAFVECLGVPLACKAGEAVKDRHASGTTKVEQALTD